MNISMAVEEVIDGRHCPSGYIRMNHLALLKFSMLEIYPIKEIFSLKNYFLNYKKKEVVPALFISIFLAANFITCSGA